MEISMNNMVSDLKLLIDVSCEDPKEQGSFLKFHKILIRMAYKATDVQIDYNRKRIYMNVLSEDESFDLIAINQFAVPMSVNLSYHHLDEFLKYCLSESLEILKHYYPFLISGFNKRKNKVFILESA